MVLPHPEDEPHVGPEEEEAEEAAIYEAAVSLLETQIVGAITESVLRDGITDIIARFRAGEVAREDLLKLLHPCLQYYPYIKNIFLLRFPQFLKDELLQHGNGKNPPDLPQLIEEEEIPQPYIGAIANLLEPRPPIGEYSVLLKLVGNVVQASYVEPQPYDGAYHQMVNESAPELGMFVVLRIPPPGEDIDVVYDPPEGDNAQDPPPNQNGNEQEGQG